MVKLDKYFVQNIHADPLKAQFVRSLVDMARASGALLVAEGVEQAEELRVLRELGVAMGQGYLIARPMGAEAFADWWHQHRRTQERVPTP